MQAAQPVTAKKKETLKTEETPQKRDTDPKEMSVDEIYERAFQSMQKRIESETGSSVSSPAL